MGEVQEHRFICKICSKSCVSGKSLGGHMRVHSALVSASKKLAKEKSEIKFQIEDDQESCKNQSNSAFPDDDEEEKIEIGDGDQSSSYGLRENPKKSWRFSDPKHGGASKIKASCKECSKDFPSLRALSGHMRSHSSKNKKVHNCKTCGKGFDSIRAMFGHMKSHSTKSRARDDNGDSLSDFDDLCPVRQKRSRIRYKSAISPSASSLNASTSAVSNLEDVEEVAKCLMMLSRGELDFAKFDLSSESSKDDSAYFGANLSCKSRNSADDGGDFDDKSKVSLSLGKVDDCALDSVDAFAQKNAVFGVDDHEMEVELDGIVEHGQVSEFDVELDCVDDSRCSESAKCGETYRDILGVNGVGETSSAFTASNSCKKGSFSANEPVSGKNCPETEDKDHQTLNDFVKKQGRNCDNIFTSPYVLGGNNGITVNVANSKLDGDDLLEHDRAGVVSTVSACSSKSKEHECQICFKVFNSGRALGGHKKAHYNGSNESKGKDSMAVKQEVGDVHNLLDLNYPITVEEGTKSDIGLNLWWADRSREHEALVLTN